jgi:hypothetical protein
MQLIHPLLLHRNQLPLLAKQSLATVEEFYQDDDGDDDEDEPEPEPPKEQTTPKKRKVQTTPTPASAPKRSKYVSKPKKSAKSLIIRLKTIPVDQRAQFLRNQIMILGLSQSDICEIACAASSVVSDLSNLDEESVANFAQECEHLRGDPNNAEFIDRVAVANTFELEQERIRLEHEIKRLQQFRDVVAYYEHLSQDIREIGAGMAEVLMRIAHELTMESFGKSKAGRPPVVN